MEGADIQVPDGVLPPIYLGGPMEMEAGFFLFSNDLECANFMQVAESIRLSSDVDILRAISQGRQP